MTALLMSELMICEVLTALEQHEPVDLRASARRCMARLPAHDETEEQLCDHLRRLAMEYGAAIVLTPP